MRPFSFESVRAIWLAIACVVVAYVGELSAAEIEPYEARVTTPRAPVLSGPGEKFYPTGTLSPGDLVEVYREQAGGWLGIRPPKGSFSVISEKELTGRNGDIAEVKEDNVASRIGSQLSDQRNAAQVRLKKGEVVEILGEETKDGVRWFKIAPPAGEFRWIHAASVERRGPIGATAPAEDDAQVVPTGATSENGAAKSEAASASNGAPAAPATAANEESWRAAPAPVEGPAASAEAAAAVVAPPLAAAAAAVAPTATSAEVPASPPAAASAAPTAAPITPVGFDLPRQLTDIEMRLSRMASAPPQLWNTERLQRDAERLLSQAKTSAERDTVKATMGKIDQFTVLGRRYQQGAGSGDPRTTVQGAGSGDPRTTGRQPLGVSPMVAGGPLPTSDGRYDAVGILRPVVSKRPGAPQYALVDERGQVVSFVTPTPDVNLQPYLGRRVGIAGNRGFIPEFNRAHVTAGRVMALVR